MHQTGETCLCKGKAHHKDCTDISRLNNTVEQLAKEAAMLGEENLWSRTEKRVTKVQLSELDLPNQLDIKELQAKDQQVQELLKKEEY